MRVICSRKRLIIGCFVFLLLASCVTAEPEPTATNFPPTSTPILTSCEEVEGSCLELSFDGDSCIYEGPSDMEAGQVALIFHNESDGWAAANLIRLLEGKTIQDVLVYNGEEPSTKHAPSWSVSVPGVYNEIEAGESHFWEGVLDPGIHALVCARTPPWPDPIGVWFGTGITVEHQ